MNSIYNEGIIVTDVGEIIPDIEKLSKNEVIERLTEMYLKALDEDGKENQKPEIN